MGKQKIDKRIIRLAQQIAEIENNIQMDKNVQENEQKIQNIVSSLSLEEMIAIDNYIFKKRYLNKEKNKKNI